jgi:hypothetical protein
VRIVLGFVVLPSAEIDHPNESKGFEHFHAFLRNVVPTRFVILAFFPVFSIGKEPTAYYIILYLS